MSRCKSCSIRLRIKLKVAFDTRKVFLNLVSLYVFHTRSNQPLFRCRRRHDRTATAFSAEMRSVIRIKNRNNHVRLASKRKRSFCCSCTRRLLESCRNFISKSLRFVFEYRAIFKINTADSMLRGTTNMWIRLDSGTTSESKSGFCRATVEPNCN